MPVKKVSTGLEGVFLVQPDVFSDDRGYFLETYHRAKYKESGIEYEFVQDNRSHSRHGVLRGLHYQLQNAQGKLVYVVRGEIFDVAVDIRRGSPYFGRWFGAYLSSENSRQIFVPEGFAHGFCVLSKTADVIYKCTDFYSPGDEYGISWSDPDIGIKWPLNSPILSQKDNGNPLLSDIPENLLPVYCSGS
ncbi:MAG TPA: dTDP-4-dehydrorhamnose 3,5-epimerase [Desulfobacteraceae bacterium]|nr:dTDP-4-dehydrorhamnose 3,5-epimerase [Desulfobacteraceae bacterium]